MRLHEVVSAMGLTVKSGSTSLEREVSGGYAGDLLSDVIANSTAGSLWITMQVHLNIVAVAVLKDLAGIVIVQGREPAADTIARAESEKVPILVSKQPAYETAGNLHALLTKSP